MNEIREIPAPPRNFKEHTEGKVTVAQHYWIINDLEFIHSTDE